MKTIPLFEEFAGDHLSNFESAGSKDARAAVFHDHLKKLVEKYVPSLKDLLIIHTGKIKPTAAYVTFSIKPIKPSAKLGDEYVGSYEMWHEGNTGAGFRKIEKELIDIYGVYSEGGHLWDNRYYPTSIHTGLMRVFVRL